MAMKILKYKILNTFIHNPLQYATMNCQLFIHDHARLEKPSIIRNQLIFRQFTYY